MGMCNAVMSSVSEKQQAQGLLQTGGSKRPLYMRTTGQKHYCIGKLTHRLPSLEHNVTDTLSLGNITANRC